MSFEELGFKSGDVVRCVGTRVSDDDMINKNFRLDMMVSGELAILINGDDCHGVTPYRGNRKWRMAHQYEIVRDGISQLHTDWDGVPVVWNGK